MIIAWLFGLSAGAQAATITVGSGGDYGTISEAVVAATSGDEIVVSAGSYPESVDLSGKSLTLRGDSGALLTTIAPTSSAAAITIDSGETDVTIEGLTLAPSGGGRGLYISGTSPIITNVVIDGAGTDGSGQGGGGYISAGSPTFENVTFRDNFAAMGGDLYITTGADVSLTNSTLDGGRANFGGSLYVLAATVRLDNVDSDGASSEHSGGFTYLNNSGALVATNLEVTDTQSDEGHGGTIFAMDHSVVSWTDGGVDGSTLSSISYEGGIFYLLGSSAMTGSGLSIMEGTAGAGGAMMLDDGSSATLVDCTFEDNLAEREGGAIAVTSTSDLTCTNCVFDQNTGEKGGAVDLSVDASFVDVNGTYTSNEATDSDGGAISVSNGAELSLSGALFTSNEAGQAGGAIYISSPGDSVEIDGTSFSLNTASSGNGGAVCTDRDTDLYITDCTFDDNQSTFGSGGAISFDVLTAGYLVQVQNSRFEDNEAGQDGGAISAEGADFVSVTDTVFIRNRAPLGAGGALFLDANEDQAFLRCRFHANLADDAGGAVAEEHSTGTSEFENCVFTENIGNTGGAVYRRTAAIQADIVNNTFAGNSALTDGAHLYLDESAVSFVNNIAWGGVDGGGLYVEDAPAASASDFYYNDVGNNSGGDYTGALSDPTGTSGNINNDPLFRDYTVDGDEDNDDLYLAPGSPCMNTGDPSIADVDGTRSDIGAFGGPNAEADDGDSDGHYDITDCNDEDPDIHPGAEEVAYDGVDQDCDGLDLTDVDLDGYDAEEVGGEDCDDDDPAVYPGGAEIWYDGIDQDCNGGSDYDADLDGFDSEIEMLGGRDCNDADASYHPAAADTVGDGEDQNCDGIDGTDADGDGYAAEGGGGDDCDDGNADVRPGAVEIGDGLDNDCDGTIDEDTPQRDDDGDCYCEVGPCTVSATPTCTEILEGDCDDDDVDINPGAAEVGDGLDNDCDGTIDEDTLQRDDDGDCYCEVGPCTVSANAACAEILDGDCDDGNEDVKPGAVEVGDGLDNDCDGTIDENTLQRDDDGDCYCEVGPCTVSADPTCTEILEGDCDDSDVAFSPGAEETWYDDIDHDCGGGSDYDADGDGQDSLEELPATGKDCDDTDATIYLGADEIPYDDVDQDCNGSDETDVDGDNYDGGPDGEDCDDDDSQVNPGAREVWYDGVDRDCGLDDDYDADADGFVPDGYAGEVTQGVSGTGSLPDGDCDDDDAETYPGAPDTWYDGVDSDCDGHSDYDADGDGFGSAEYDGQDCDDNNASTYPGATEQLDGLDNDCDGLDEMADRDEDGVADWYEWMHGTSAENPDSDGDGWSDGEEYGGDVEHPRNTDGDADIDALDIDDDNDRIPTQKEQNEDINGDGLPDRDVDRDGVPNALDSNSDGDRYSDREEGAQDQDADGIPDYLDFQGDFVGGGCTGCSNAGNGVGGFWLVLFGLFGALSRRRALGAAAVLLSPAALAQDFTSPPVDAHGFWVAETSGDPARSVRLVYPGIGDGWAAGLLLDYGANPLRERTLQGRSKVLVDTLVTSHVYGAYDWEVFRFDASYPITVYGHDQVGGFAASGDMRLGALWPFLPLNGQVPGVGVQALTWLPTGSRGRWSGSPGIGGGMVLTMAQQVDRFGYTVNAGVRLGMSEKARNVTSGTSPIGGLDLNYTLPVLNDGIGVGVDTAIQGATGFKHFPLEPGVHARGRLESGGFAVLGAAMGIGEAIGGAEWRAYMGIGYGGIPEKAETGGGTVVVPVIMERIERLREDGPLAQLIDNRILLREQVFFKEAKAEILSASEPVLQAVLVVLVDHPEIEHLLVEGHTNSRASRSYNRRLSQARAEAVCAWLELNGVDGARLIPKGFGEDRPLVKDSHPDSMVINRRVEFTVLRSDEAGEAGMVPDVGNLPEELREDR